MSGVLSLTLSAADARVLRATDPFRERSVARVAELAGCGEDVAASCLRRLRGALLVEPDGCRPAGWLRTHRGDVALEPPAVSRTRAGGLGRLSANQPQANDCFRTQRVERAPVGVAPAAAGRWIVRARADVAWRAAFRGAALLERGMPVSARGAAWPVHVSGGLCRSAQPHDLRAPARSGARRAACAGDAAQRGAASGDLADQSRAAAPAGAWVMAGGGARRGGGRGRREHARGAGLGGGR